MIFPRYHQLQAVRQLVKAARQEGVGHNYLVEHSAGSGKSIAMTEWQERPVLVTGAGGFIGSHVVGRLAAAGARVRALVRYNSRGDCSLEISGGVAALQNAA